MKLGLVAHASGTQGGIESVVFHLSSWAARLGHQVTVFAMKAPDKLPKGVTFVPVKVPQRLPHALRQLYFAWQSARVIAKHPVDVLESHVNTFAPAEVMVCHSVHPLGTARVLALDSNPFRRFWQKVKSFGPLLNWLSGVNYRNPALKVAVATSNGIGRELLSLYPGLASKMVTITNGFDPAFRFPASPAQRQRLRKGFGLKKDDVALLFIGREFHRKGLEPILRALPLLPTRVQAWVIGDNVDTVPSSHYFNLVKELGLEQRVRFLGHQGGLLPYYQAADAFVFPTLYEAFAMVSIESLACGLPLLAARTNGTEDLVVEGKNGAFVERTGESVAAAVKRYILPLARRRQLSRGALATAKDYSWEKIARRNLAVCAGILKARGRG